MAGVDLEDLLQYVRTSNKRGEKEEVCQILFFIAQMEITLTRESSYDELCNKWDEQRQTLKDHILFLKRNKLQVLRTTLRIVH